MAVQQIEKLMSQKEVAAYLGVSESWLEMQRFKKTGLKFCKIGRRCLYRPCDVQQYVQDHMVGTEI